MFEPRVLKKPPIVEAIYTITFKDPLDISKLEEFVNTDFIKRSFPDIRDGYAVKISNNMPTASNRDGFTLSQTTELKKRSIQVRRTYLSFHNLNIYDGWDVMISELKELWAVFSDMITNADVKELRVRNINKITIPFGSHENLDIKDYVNIMPTIPEGIDPNLNGFFIQIKTGEPTKNLEAAVSVSTLSVDNNNRTASISLDIHVGKKDHSKGGDEIWNTFNQLREYKDFLFFKVVTDESLKLFEK